MLSPAVILAAALAAPTAPPATPTASPATATPAATTATAPASAAKLAFPAPRLAQVTDATKCDFGTVLTLDAVAGRMQGMTKAGPVTYVVGPDVQLFSAEGKPIGAAAGLAVGARYHAYYVLDGGAKALEIDLD